jgi:hypothetical protein
LFFYIYMSLLVLVFLLSNNLSDLKAELFHHTKRYE